MDPGDLFFECRFFAYFLHRFWIHLGTILDSKMVPGGLLFEGSCFICFLGCFRPHFGNLFGPFWPTFLCKNGVKVRVMVPGGSKVVILDNLGPHFGAFGASWGSKVAIFNNFGPHFGAF